ncbi:oxidoreductase [Flavimarina sp. Hel_I_48]|uniref:oxidoreductase n=1 Tax=Flavimarina sp. Hel_I_48 TaxID=1392488 RepID=UPI0004DF8533|nr:oxidoreductase [Flavimarina sp. Hel_I_48]
MSFNLKNIKSQPQRVALVTGANGGLGFETTRVLLSKHMRVVMACRDLDKGAKAKQKLLDHYPEARLELLPLDLASLDSVRNFAEAYLEKYSRLDLLINNAGVMVPPYKVTEDGYELQFQANYLGHFLLTGLLLERLTSTEKSRVVLLSSKAHERASINFEDLQSEKNYARWKAYGQSKLACLIFAKELNRRLRRNDFQTIAVAAHPGISNTGLFRYFPKWFNQTLGPLLSPFISHPPEKAVKPTLKAALEKNITGGSYYGPTGFMGFKGAPGKVQSSENANDESVAKRLWKVSEELVGFKYLDSSN